MYLFELKQGNKSKPNMNLAKLKSALLFSLFNMKLKMTKNETRNETEYVEKKMKLSRTKDCMCYDNYAYGNSCNVTFKHHN